MATVVNFLSIPSTERRVLIAGPSTEQEVAASVTDWKGIGIAGGAFGAGGVFLPVIWSMVGPPGATSGNVSASLVKKMMASTHQLPAGVVGIDHRAMAANLKLPSGHPMLDQAYAIHPLDPQRYLPIGTFHETLFEEKRSQLFTLLTSLGAKSITVKHRSGYPSTANFTTGAPKAPPSIPTPLAWYAHEQAWRDVAERRMKSGLREATMELAYKEDYGVNASLASSLAGFRVKLGDSGSQFEPTVWDVHVEFAAP